MIATPKRTIGVLAAVATAMAMMAMPGRSHLPGARAGAGRARGRAARPRLARPGAKFPGPLGRSPPAIRRGPATDRRPRRRGPRLQPTALGQGPERGRVSRRGPATNGGAVVTLHGTVADAEARDRAVRLSVETVGVDRVVDKLRVADVPPQPRPTESGQAFLGADRTPRTIVRAARVAPGRAGSRARRPRPPYRLHLRGPREGRGS